MKTLIFPIIAIVLSIVAYLFPGGFTPLKGYIIPLLVVIMLGMGITLSINDFKQILRKKKPFF